MKTPIKPQRNWEGIYEPDDDELEGHMARPFTRIVDATGATVVTAHDFFQFRPGDAERIVECVNALAGIEDPAGYIRMMRAHVGAQHDSLGRMVEREQQLVSERDELESALRAIAARVQGVYDLSDLAKWGPLTTINDDVYHIATTTLKGTR